jgi:HD superfamily phosphodiesterase
MREKLQKAINFLEDELLKLENQKWGSIVHSTVHIQTVVNLSTFLVKFLNADDGLLKEKVRLAALIHDRGRFFPDPNDEDHAETSSRLAEELLNDYEISRKITEEIVDSVRKHTKGGSNFLTGRIIYTADKLEQIAPIAPFRRAVYVGEIFSGKPLSPQSSLAEYIDYFLTKVSGLTYDTIEQKGILIPEILKEEIPEYNSVVLKKIESELDLGISQRDDIKLLIAEKARKAFLRKENPAIELTLFGINIGYGCYTTKNPFNVMLNRIKEMKNEGFSHEDLTFLKGYGMSIRKYLERWGSGG